MTNDRKCRWGILGSAGIAQKNWQAMAHAENAELVAVASRDQAKAREFIERCAAQVPLAHEPDAVSGYDELLARCRSVDAIYLPLPTGLRTEWALKVAQAGSTCCAKNPAGLRWRRWRAWLKPVSGREFNSWMGLCSCTAIVWPRFGK